MLIWNENSFGSGPIPQNFDEICDVANEMISKFQSENPNATDDDIQNYSDSLWTTYCMTDMIGDIHSIW